MVKILKEKSKKPAGVRVDVIPALGSLVSILAWSCFALLVIHVFLTVMHYKVIELPWLIRELFDVDEEESVPTWFSSVILLIAASYLSYISFIKRRTNDPNARSWLYLSCGFLFLSIDEVAGFHEAINSIMDASWAVPGAFLALLLLLGFARLLKSLPSRIGKGFVAAGAIYVGGAIGVELATEPYLYNDELDTLAYNLWTVVEEGMEMGGIIFFLHVLNRYASEFLKPEVHL